MKCANCRQEESPAYTLWAHVDRDDERERDDRTRRDVAQSDGAQSDGARNDRAQSDGARNDRARSDGGEVTIKLQFCSIECLDSWT